MPFVRDFHILPVEDFKPHEDRRECWCKPVDKGIDGGSHIWVHNSMDRREHTIEKGITQ